MISIIFRTIIFYLVYTFLKDKKLILFLSVIWSYSIINYESELWIYLLITLLVITLDFLFSVASIKIPRLKKYKEDNLVINNGKINFNILESKNYSISDLIHGIKSKNVESIDDILYATIDENNKLQIVLNERINNAPIPIILDGEVKLENLANINKDYSWINKILSNQKIKLNNVIYGFYDNNKCFIIKK